MPVVTSTLRVSVRSVTGLSLASARMSWTLFFSPGVGGFVAEADHEVVLADRLLLMGGVGTSDRGISRAARVAATMAASTRRWQRV